MHTCLIIKIIWAVRNTISVEVCVLVGAVAMVVMIFAGAVVDVTTA